MQSNLPDDTAKDTKTLNLSGTLLQSIPHSVYNHASTLETLDVSSNNLTDLPGDLDRFTNLRRLFASNNRFSTCPLVLGKCRNLEMLGLRNCGMLELPGNALPLGLRWLILTENLLTSLPAEIGERPKLQKLMLSCNKLSALPDLSQCRNLELLRIASNAFTELPEQVFDIPNIAWLAIAGNPFTAGEEAKRLSHSSFRYEDIELQEFLGEGASGHIWKAKCKNQDDSIAVKVFKSGNTSDGTPHSELAAGLAAGSHESLLTPIGAVANHPEGKLAMALPLLPNRFVNLARPPNFETCTRDVYDIDVEFPPEKGSRIIAHIRDAVAHIHAKEVVHGDLYAHNILWDPATGEAVLGDFGAAVIAASLSPQQKLALKSIEKRALDIFVREVSERIRPAPGTK